MIYMSHETDHVIWPAPDEAKAAEIRSKKEKPHPFAGLGLWLTTSPASADMPTRFGSKRYAIVVNIDPKDAVLVTELSLASELQTVSVEELRAQYRSRGVNVLFMYDDVRKVYDAVLLDYGYVQSCQRIYGHEDV